MFVMVIIMDASSILLYANYALKSKDKDYVNKLIESIYEQNDEDIDPYHKVCPICGSVHFKKNGKDKNGHQRYICLD